MRKVDIEKMTASKSEFREELAARPILEKLWMLDELRRRSRTLEAARPTKHRDGPPRRG